MSLHPLAEQFGSVAASYERGRPEYAPAVVGALSAELGLRPHAAVLDLGAGTGKLSRALAAAGLDVVAVEPLPQLREVLISSIGAEHVLEGVAEAIPLPEDSVDAVTAADSFHWFDHAAALAEIRRVLRPGGGLAVLSTLPDWRGASWADDLGELVRRTRPEHPGFDGPRWQDAVTAAGGWTAPREVRVTTSAPADREGLLEWIASFSWIAAMPAERRAETLAEMDALIAQGHTPERLGVHVVIGLTSLLEEPA